MAQKMLSSNLELGSFGLIFKADLSTIPYFSVCVVLDTLNYLLERKTVASSYQREFITKSQKILEGLNVPSLVLKSGSNCWSTYLGVVPGPLGDLSLTASIVLSISSRSSECSS